MSIVSRTSHFKRRTASKKEAKSGWFPVFAGEVGVPWKAGDVSLVSGVLDAFGAWAASAATCVAGVVVALFGWVTGVACEAGAVDGWTACVC